MNNIGPLLFGITGILVVGLCLRMLITYVMEPSRWWVRPRHRWFSRPLCALGIHLHGRRGMSSLHNTTVCRYCGDDVLFTVLKDKDT